MRLLQSTRFSPLRFAIAAFLPLLLGTRATFKVRYVGSAWVEITDLVLSRAKSLYRKSIHALSGLLI